MLERTNCWRNTRQAGDLRHHTAHVENFLMVYSGKTITLQWRHNEGNGVFTYLTVCSGADQRVHESSASLAFVRKIHQWPVNSPHRGPVTRKLFPFDDVFMNIYFDAWDHRPHSRQETGARCTEVAARYWSIPDLFSCDQAKRFTNTIPSFLWSRSTLCPLVLMFEWGNIFSFRISTWPPENNCNWDLGTWFTVNVIITMTS